MKTLMQMFATEDRGVVFFESVINLKSQRHTCIEAIPLPFELFDEIPGYFQVRPSPSLFSHTSAADSAPCRDIRKRYYPQNKNGPSTRNLSPSRQRDRFVVRSCRTYRTLRFNGTTRARRDSAMSWKEWTMDRKEMRMETR